MRDLREIKNELKNSTSGSKDKPSKLDGLYVYFSYDLVNSTKFKLGNNKTWPSVIHWFYELVHSGLKKRISEVSIWRSVGDELLLYKKIHSKPELDDIAEKAHSVLIDTIYRLHEKLPANHKNLISAKATIWSAYVNYLPPQEIASLTNTHKNIIISHESNQNDHHLDFLGPDIDVGFRIAEHSLRSRLVVCSNLSYLLYRRSLENFGSKDSILDHLKIVSYEKLKGIWNDRHYPIIWYEKDWAKINESFHYDERFESKLIDKIMSKPEDPSSIKILKSIFENLGDDKYIEGVWENLPSEHTTSDSEVFILPQNNVEVHCVSICFNQKNEVLIGKRKKDKRLLPGIWEFGCGQLEMSDSFENCLRKSYKEDFNAELKFKTPLVPISTFEIRNSHDQIAPGIIFTAEILNCKEVSNIRHEEILWFKMDNFNASFDKDEYVQDFKENITLAYETYFKR